VGVKKVLTTRQLDSALKGLPDWELNAKRSFLKASFPQSDYISGLVFMARIAVHAELLQHHPDVTWSYDHVSVKLTTHDVKGISKLDIALAERISKLRNHK
jgi:4a-hydroxytetrahydrobiopterin dehydratase